ncbi:TorD/DmsD family molecular chaperone [Seleniivibrio woodruffii]|uniref:Nitrate reductase delta subunit n=1 Tax=Seleniivibrio woodruffii TaxID=1078050 RepID=A0A4R1K3I9_9BACT|nr:molecular chaperone TorD family protein [Seleniivibrio woodruffii]TCK58467.1 nitrate reductase delta subunit [Seleniivibrio woodruffii]TVZ36840.1 nitrate reductase delta subunit [Seleniivibrio woodruffii]
MKDLEMYSNLGNTNNLPEWLKFYLEIKSEMLIWAFLSKVYNECPNENFLMSIDDYEFAQFIGAFSDESHKNDTTLFIQSMEKSKEKIADSAFLIQMQKDWTKLFRGISPEYGPMPPYEELYIEHSTASATQKALSEKYLLGNYNKYSDVKNRLDYIGVELEFLSKLAYEQMRLLENDKDIEFEKIRNLYFKFLQEHIGRWADSFIVEAAKHASTDFYQSVLVFTGVAIRNLIIKKI